MSIASYSLPLFRHYWRVMLILLLASLVYWPGLSGGFIFDDFGNLVDNPAFAPDTLHAHFWNAIWSSDSGPTERPLSMLSFALQGWFTGLAPQPLKLVNVLIHITNGLLIYSLSRSVLMFIWADRRTAIGGSDSASSGWLITPTTLAWLITAAWLLSPMQLTAVLYVIQRMESLSALFVLGGLLLYWQGRMHLMAGKPDAWWLILTGLLGGTILAVFAKETGVMLPVYAFLLEWLILRGRSAKGFEPRFVALYALILFIPGIVGLLFTLPNVLNGTAYAGRPFDLAQRLWTEGRVLVDYLHWIIAPSPDDLSLYHDDLMLSTGWLSPWTTITSWGLIGGLLGSALWLKNRAPLFALGVLWFFAGHALVSTYLPLELVYEHRNYLPSWGVFMALFGLIFTWSPANAERRAIMRTLMIGSAMALVTLYAGLTGLRAQVWGNPYRLAYFESTSHPDSPRASYDLGRIMVISSSGIHSPLFQLGFQQLEKTSKLPSASLQADQALIFMAAKSHLPVNPAWWQNLRAKIDHQPLSVEDIGALYSLINCGIDGVCRYTPHDLAELRQTLDFAVRHYPKNAKVITLYANFAANLTHDYPRAYGLMQRAVALDPKNFDFWKNLVTLQIAAGQIDDAQASIERMRELNIKEDIHSTSIRLIEAQLKQKQEELNHAVHSIDTKE